jgi:hypothetical protein
MPRDVTEFADYLTDNYISEDSSFPPYIWAECSTDISRTMNCCENSHSKFKNYCLAYHPNIQNVPAKTFDPNISVIFQRIFVKFKMQIF